MKQLFKKKDIFKIKSIPLEPASMQEPTTADEYQKRGMAYYARKKLSHAIADLQRAIALDGNNIDAFYCLGMVLKAMHCKDESMQAFNRVIILIKERSEVGEARYGMLRRLALGHINQLTQGDWNLEKEIWKRTV